MVHRISFVAIRVAPSHSQIPFPYTALIETTCTCRWCNFPANLFCHLHYSSYRAFLVLVWYKSYSLPSLIHIKREKKWFLALRVLFSKKSIASSSIPSLQRSYRFTLHPPLYASSQNEREKRNREHPRATIATWSTSRRSDGFRFPQDRRTPPPPQHCELFLSLCRFLSLTHLSYALHSWYAYFAITLTHYPLDRSSSFDLLDANAPTLIHTRYLVLVDPPVPSLLTL